MKKKDKLGWIRENFWNVLVIIVLWEIFKIMVKLLIIFTG